MKKIAIFNHKGGVSKTTTTFNLGWKLANMGKRVLLVDADSQCNLTQYALGIDEFEKYYESGNTNNIKDALEPAFNDVRPFCWTDLTLRYLVMGSVLHRTHSV